MHNDDQCDGDGDAERGRLGSALNNLIPTMMINVMVMVMMMAMAICTMMINMMV